MNSVLEESERTLMNSYEKLKSTADFLEEIKGMSELMVQNFKLGVVENQKAREEKDFGQDRDIVGLFDDLNDRLNYLCGLISNNIGEVSCKIK